MSGIAHQMRLKIEGVDRDRLWSLLGDEDWASLPRLFPGQTQFHIHVQEGSNVRLIKLVQDEKLSVIITDAKGRRIHPIVEAKKAA